MEGWERLLDEMGGRTSLEGLPNREGLFQHILIDEQYRITLDEEGHPVLVGCKKVE